MYPSDLNAPGDCIRRFITSNARLLISSLLLLIATSAEIRADRVEYKDGRILEGRIVFQDENSVRIKDGSGEIRIPMKSIRRIIPGTEADTYLIEAKSEFGRGDVHRAVAKLAEAATQEISPESLAVVIQRYEHRLRENAPYFDSAGRRDMATVLDRVSRATLQRKGQLLLTRIRLHMAIGDFEMADELLERMAQEFARLFEAEKGSLSQGFNDEIDRALDGRDFARALELVIRFRRLDLDAAGDKQTLLDLRWARDEREKENYEKALGIYIDRLMDRSPEIAKNRIVDALAEAERLCRRRDELGRAIELYEIYGMPHTPNAVRGRLTRLWIDAGETMMDREAYADARRMFERAEGLTPGTSLRAIHRAEFAARSTTLAPTDALEHYRLGEWCVEMKLYPEARKSFEMASTSEPLRSTAWAQLSFVDNAIAEDELKQLVGFFEKGDYSATLEGLSRYQGQPLAPGLRKQAVELERLTRNGIYLRAKARPQQAEVLWQHAERAFYAGEVADSAMTLRTLIKRFGDTPAGVRAEIFYDKIQTHFDLDEIERGRRPSVRTRSGSEGRTVEATPLAIEIDSLRGSIRRVDTERDSSDDGAKAPGHRSDLGLRVKVLR